MNNQFKRYLQINLIFLDLLILNLSFYLPKWIVIGKIETSYTSAYFSFLFFSNVIWLVLSFVCGNYTEKIILQFEFFTKRTIQVYILWIIFLFTCIIN